MLKPLLEKSRGYNNPQVGHLCSGLVDSTLTLKMQRNVILLSHLETLQNKATIFIYMIKSFGQMKTEENIFILLEVIYHGQPSAECVTYTHDILSM